MKKAKSSLSFSFLMDFLKVLINQLDINAKIILTLIGIFIIGFIIPFHKLIEFYRHHIIIGVILTQWFSSWITSIFTERIHYKNRIYSKSYDTALKWYTSINSIVDLIEPIETLKIYQNAKVGTFTRYSWDRFWQGIDIPVMNLNSTYTELEFQFGDEWVESNLQKIKFVNLLNEAKTIIIKVGKKSTDHSKDMYVGTKEGIERINRLTEIRKELQTMMKLYRNIMAPKFKLFK